MILNNRTYVYAAFAAILFLAASCQEDGLQYADQDINIEMDSPITIVLDDAQTRATDVTSLSSFYVRCISSTPAKSYETSPWQTTFSNDGSGNYTGGQYWPGSSVSYSFYASNNSITLSTSGTYITASSSTDVVVAKALSTTYKSTVGLTFNHIFAKIGYCYVTPPSGFTVSNLSVTMTPLTSGRYYVYDGSWGTTSSTSYTLATTTKSTSALNYLIIPGSYTLSLSYKLTKDSYNETFSKSVTFTFVAGKTNNIEITLPAGNPSKPGGGVVVDPWEGDDDIFEEM